MAKLTPTAGPWQVKNDHDGRTIVIANVEGEIFADGSSSYSYDFVCDTYGDGDDDSRSMAIAIANARLIAAAPDLLEALRVLCNPDASFHDGEVRIPLASHGAALEAMRKAREAVSKAEGR